VGRKRKSAALDVYLGRSHVGAYSRSASGATSFRYDPSWLNSDRSFAISLSLPLSDRQWTGDRIASVFDGLLPDNSTVRETIAAREGADSASTFDLLAAIGRDCVGALRFIPEGDDPGDPTLMRYEPIDDADIARRLAGLATNPLGMLGDDDFRISLAGVEEKTAFLRVGNEWHIPRGATPTSHIFKPPMRHGPLGLDFSDSPWNEWLCLLICTELGLPTAKAESLLFDGKPVLVIERFDRRWVQNILYRLPQEDMCQALGIPPSRKYQSEGGPDIIAVLDILNSAASPRADRLTFFKAQIVFWLLAAIDGHAKNFSVFLTPGGFNLTPLYDVMSAAPYSELPAQKVKLAMSIGNNRHYRVREIQPRHFYQTGQKAGLYEEDIRELLGDVTAKIDAALTNAGNAAQKAGMPEKTASAIIEGIQSRTAILKANSV